jgi:hypothetical protein
MANSIACRHPAIASILVSPNAAGYKLRARKVNPAQHAHMIGFNESMN